METEKNISFKDLTVVLVLYRSTNLVLDLIKELKNISIVIVDNGGNKNVIDQIKEINIDLKILTQNKNLGYGRAINLAFQKISTKYFVVLNPDLSIKENDIYKLLVKIDSDKNCAIAGPITKPDKDFYGIFPEKGKNIRRNSTEKKSSEILDNKLIEGPVCVDVIKGCALMINSEIFRSVGMFNEKYFLFWEEIDLCRKIRKFKFSTIVFNDIIAYHNVSSSSKKDYLTFFIRAFHNELSPNIYFNANKFSSFLFYKLLKYIFRFFTYLFIFNFKKSIKNLAKLLAITFYIFNTKL